MTTSTGDARTGQVVLQTLAAIPGGATPDELAAVIEQPLGIVLDELLELLDSGAVVDRGHALRVADEHRRDGALAAVPVTIRKAIARRAADVLADRGADPERVGACVLAGADIAAPADIARLVDLGHTLRDTHPAAATDLLHAALAGIPARDDRSFAVTLDLAWALVGDGRAAEVDALLDARIGPYHPAEPVAVQRVRNIAASIGGRIDVVLRRYADIDADALGARYDRFDGDTVDAVAELGLLWVVGGRIADAATVIAWVEASPTAPTPFRLATVAMVMAWQRAVEGRFEEAAALARRALEHAERDPTAAATGAPPALLLAISLDQLGSGDDAMTVTRGRAVNTAVPRWGPPMLQFFAAITLLRRGDWDAALAESEAGLVAARRIGLGMSVFWPNAVRALVAVARGDTESARVALDEARAAAVTPGLGGEWLLYASAVLDESCGDLQRAAATVDLLVGGAEAAGAPALLLNGGPDMMRIALAAGEGGVAKQIGDHLQAMTARTESPIVAGLAAWAGGLLLGDAAEVEAAAAVLAACRRDPEAARARHDAAVIAARAGDHVAARRCAGEALAVYDRLDASYWRRRLIGELKSLGIAVAGPRRRVTAVSGWDSLTDTEAAVVELLGSGLSNAAIAERLYVSRRTVESHLRRVYAKLTIASRSELVAAAARRL